MAITKNCGRQEVISSILTFKATDLDSSVVGTGTATTHEAIQLPENAIVTGGSLTITEAFDTGGVKAYGVLTAVTTYVPTALQTVTIGTTVYTWVAALSAGPTVAYEVLINGAVTSFDNLVAAINGAAGIGVTYSTGTVAHPNVTAVHTSDYVVTVTSTANSTADDTIATTETMTLASWAAATLVNFDPPLDTLVVQIGATGYIASTNADVLATRVALVPTGVKLTAVDTLDVIWDTAATSISVPTVGEARLEVEYIIANRATFSEG